MFLLVGNKAYLQVGFNFLYYLLHIHITLVHAFLISKTEKQLENNECGFRIYCLNSVIEFAQK